MTWVKICGTTNLEDALLAVQAGADAIGFVMAPSKRQVTPEMVGEITKRLPESVEKIGVFLNESPDRIIEAAKRAGLTGVQLHGDESTATAGQLAEAKVATVVKGIHSGPALEADLAAWSSEQSVRALLLDSGDARNGGGTGKTFDWEYASVALHRVSPQTRVIVAGGLNPENVQAAIKKFQPWGVDVASGVESYPGKKDPQKVKEFIAAVRSAEVNRK